MVVVGAWHNDEKADNAGHAKVFRFDGSNWNQVGQPLLGDNAEDQFGWYVSMSDDGRTVAASARLGSPSGKDAAGFVRVFTLDTSDNWVQLGKDLDGESAGEEFGRAMAMSSDGRRLAVGTTVWNDETGIVRVFDYSGDDWKQVGGDLTGDKPYDWFGSGVALSANGSVLAIGSDGVDTNWQNGGLIRVFHLEGCCTWTKYGQDIEGEGNQARLGMHQLSLSDDGGCLAAGASHINNEVGKGYLYENVNGQWNQVAELSGDVPGDHLGESMSVSGDCRVAVYGASEIESRPGYFLVYYADHKRPGV